VLPIDSHALMVTDMKTLPYVSFGCHRLPSNQSQHSSWERKGCWLIFRPGAMRPIQRRTVLPSYSSVLERWLFG